MDPLTYLLLTRRFVSTRPAIVVAGLAPDAPFYLTYPAWIIRQGQLRHALRTGDWPAPPRWIATPHHAATQHASRLPGGTRHPCRDRALSETRTAKLAAAHPDRHPDPRAPSVGSTSVPMRCCSSTDAILLV
jgi:hypothetical protein